ncbi:MAG: GNAT family N-acetyltransferase [Methylococcaceae bacterium]|nr:GNAT family N-acetyltransferase [Methylococcaceae bacterium]
MLHYTIRKGKTSDKQWLFELYSLTLRAAIEATWGWDVEFQFNLFSEHLQPEKFEILLIEDKPIGGFYVVQHADHFWLEMLLIHPGYQGRGIGKRIVRQIQRTSASKNKVLKLCVIKANPVRLFYEKLGFKVYDEDKAFYQMRCETQVTR